MENIFKDIQKTNSDEAIQLVNFKLGEEEFGVDILNVQEIIKMTQLTRVPNTPSYVKGVINLRGKVVPIIDLRIKLGLPISNMTRDSRVVVIEYDNKIIGFIVDNVNEVIRINRNIIEAPPAMTTGIDSDFITAIVKLENKLLILLDMNLILMDNKFTENENILS